MFDKCRRRRPEPGLDQTQAANGPANRQKKNADTTNFTTQRGKVDKTWARNQRQKP